MAEKIYNRARGTDQTMAAFDRYYARPLWAEAVRLQSDSAVDEDPDFKWGFTERIWKVRVQNITTGVITNYDNNAIDGVSTTSVTMNSFAAGDFLYVATNRTIKGLYVDVTSTNSNASVMTVKYLNTAGVWTDIVATDGTANSGAAFGKDGSITWTVPSDWDMKYVDGVGGPHLFLRIEVSAALDSSVSIIEMFGIPAIDDYTIEQGTIDGVINVDLVTISPALVGGIQAKSTSGTPRLAVNWYGRR